MTNPKLAEIYKECLDRASMVWNHLGDFESDSDVIEAYSEALRDFYRLGYELGREDENDESRKAADRYCVFGDKCDPKVTHCRPCMVSIEIRSRRQGTGEVWA